MLATISKKITERWVSCRFLLAALKRQGPKVAEILLQHAHRHLVEGDAVPNFLATIVSLRRRLGDSMDRLMALDQKVFAIRASLTALRGERNELASSLGKAIVRMRRSDASLGMSADSESKATWSGASSRRATGAPPFTPRETSTSMREPDRVRRVTFDASDRAPTASRSSPTAPSSDVTTSAAR